MHERDTGELSTVLGTTANANSPSLALLTIADVHQDTLSADTAQSRAKRTIGQGHTKYLAVKEQSGCHIVHCMRRCLQEGVTTHLEGRPEPLCLLA